MSHNVNTYDHSSEGSPERKVYNQEYNQEVNVAGQTDLVQESGHHLHRGLSSRQITMIAIGGAIGTGLIIGT